MATQVGNVKHAPAGWQQNPQYVYIGRPGRGLQGPWGNPYVPGRDGTLEQVIGDYYWWLMDQPELLALIPSLKDRTLLCFCAPNRCHGDVLAALAEGSS